MIRTIRYAACLLMILHLAACRKGDQVAGYIVIPSVTVNASEAEGGGTSKITDAWISVNDRSVGVWELPARVPVLGTGIRKITVAPAVKRNGSFDDRVRYPFYTSFDTSVDLAPERSVEIAPVVSYAAAATFWTEGFEDVGNRFIVSAASDTTLLIYTPSANPDVVLNGTPCGGFVLDPAHDVISIYTDEDFAPSTGPAFVELDYSTDIDLTIGYTFVESGVTRSEAWVVLVATASEGGLRWNKVYIDVSAYFNASGIVQRDLYLSAALPSGRSSAHVYLDNFKLVRRTP